MGKIIYKDLGRIDYPEALKVQTEAFEGADGGFRGFVAGKGFGRGACQYIVFLRT